MDGMVTCQYADVWERNTVPGKDGRLSRKDWLAAAFRLLGEGGVEAVAVEPLARALGVTKGSFYWHFKDRPALLRSLLGYWAERETQAIIRRVERPGGSARERLRRLLAEAIGDTAARGPELAVREWARRDAVVRRAVRRVDAKRLRYVRDLFEEAGRGEPAVRADLLYSLLFGEVLFVRKEKPAERAERFEACLKMIGV
ncbi:MAG: TetR/AcrR family transcriptional regulator [Alphaproteobacteria bacterium]